MPAPGPRHGCATAAAATRRARSARFPGCTCRRRASAGARRSHTDCRPHATAPLAAHTPAPAGSCHGEAPARPSWNKAVQAPPGQAHSVLLQQLRSCVARAHAPHAQRARVVALPADITPSGRRRRRWNFRTFRNFAARALPRVLSQCCGACVVRAWLHRVACPRVGVCVASWRLRGWCGGGGGGTACRRAHALTAGGGGAVAEAECGFRVPARARPTAPPVLA